MIKFSFEQAQPVENVNSRVDYDLRYSAKTGRFNMSQEIFNRFDIQNNGFNILRSGDMVALEVVPNDVADLHSGREGKNKGLIFTAKSLANSLGLTEDTEMSLDSYKEDGRTALIVELPESSEDTLDTNVVSNESEDHSELDVETNEEELTY